ncbi:MAG: ATPase [Alphaproteobacteria bacterium]|nr:ATPase [Alphaproteobacteria bacterium]
MSALKKPLPDYAMKEEGGLYALYRDGEMMKTPRDLPLAVAHRKLAEAMLHECLAQTEERLDLRKMPMVQMTLTVLDIAPLQRGNIIDGIMRYADSELVCQRAMEPDDLMQEQHRVWQPFLDWCEARFNIGLLLGSGVVPFQQLPETLAPLRAYVESLDDYRLIGVSEAVGVSSSLVLGLALATGYADAESVFNAAELEQLWQVRKWGADAEIQERHAAIRRDLDDCQSWFSLLG